jgi:NADH-quinone oxidoreductase subunit H
VFLGGWHAPWPIGLLWDGADRGYWPVLWFVGKVLFFLFGFVWLRGTLPRLRYDQFMHFGWTRLMPLSLVWILAVATVRAIDLDGRQWLVAVALCVAVVGILMFVGEKKQSDEAARQEEPTAFDAFAGGYPVPPPRGRGA